MGRSAYPRGEAAGAWVGAEFVGFEGGFDQWAVGDPLGGWSGCEGLVEGEGRAGGVGCLVAAACGV